MAIVQVVGTDRHRYHGTVPGPVDGTGTGTGPVPLPLLACWVFGATRRCNVRLVTSGVQCASRY